MRTLKLCAGILLLTVFFVQAQSADQLFLITKEKPRLDQLQEYEKNCAGWISNLNELKPDVPDQIVLATNENIFYWVTPIKELSDIQKMKGLFSAVEQKAGKKNFESFVSGGIEYKELYVVNRSEELSYTTPLAGEKNNYAGIEHYFVKPDKREEAIQLLKEYKDLCISINSPQGYYMYTTVIGDDRDVITEICPAPDQSTFNKREYDSWIKGGKKSEEIYYKFMACLRDYKTESGYYRHDISYHNQKAAGLEKK